MASESLTPWPAHWIGHPSRRFPPLSTHFQLGHHQREEPSLRGTCFGSLAVAYKSPHPGGFFSGPISWNLWAGPPTGCGSFFPGALLYVRLTADTWGGCSSHLSTQAVVLENFPSLCSLSYSQSSLCCSFSPWAANALDESLPGCFSSFPLRLSSVQNLGPNSHFQSLSSLKSLHKLAAECSFKGSDCIGLFYSNGLNGSPLSLVQSSNFLLCDSKGLWFPTVPKYPRLCSHPLNLAEHALMMSCHTWWKAGQPLGLRSNSISTMWSCSPLCKGAPWQLPDGTHSLCLSY